MEEMIHIFLSAIKKQCHVLKLIENLDGLKLKLACEDAETIIVFRRGEVFLLVENSDRSDSYVISGERGSICSLLEGNEKLRTLIHNKKLRLTAPFRTILLIESIFYLTKPDKQFEKFIS